MFQRKVVDGILDLLCASVPHLEAGAVLGDPQVEVCLGPARKMPQRTRGPDPFHNRHVDVAVPVCRCLGEGRIVAGAQAHVELVDLDMLLQAAIAAGTGQFDPLLRAGLVQSSVLQELGIPRLEDQVVSRGVWP